MTSNACMKVRKKAFSLSPCCFSLYSRRYPDPNVSFLCNDFYLFLLTSRLKVQQTFNECEVHYYVLPVGLNFPFSKYYKRLIN